MGADANELRVGIPKELKGRFVVGTKIVERPSCFVYRGVDRELGDRAVAIKFFIDRPLGRAELIDAFEREVALLRAASHPALVPIISGGHDQDWLFLVMEYIDGITLRDYLKAKPGPLDVEAAVEMVCQLAAALKEVHEKNGYHGHLDSRAILFKGDEPRIAGYYPHVISEIQKSTTTAGRLIVDPAYISPDQISGSGGTDGRADIYSLSVLLYEMLTGQRPYQADSPMQLAMMRLSKDPEPPRKLNPAIPALVDAAVMRGLARDRNQRFATMGDLVDALTGGKKPIKNPLLAAMEGEGERLGGTETIAVSMSTEAIKHLLHNHEAKKQAAPKPAPKDNSAVGTVTGARAVTDGNEQLAAAATMMGMKVEESLKGSFVVMNGDLRGQKYFLDRPQVMIGSDAGCDLVFPGKGVPPRYAILVQRSGEFYAAPLSGAPLTINNQPVTGTEEVKLKRGDVLFVGPHHLRFIAPGEVFAMRDDVADRLIDRPPNKLPKILAMSALAATLVCGGLFYVYRENTLAAARQKKASVEGRKLQQKNLIDKLRQEGDDFFRNGALIEPVDANARKRFEQILEIDQEDTYAKRRLTEISERVKTLTEQEGRRRQFAERIARLDADGQRYFQSGNYISPPGGNARESYQEILRLDPQNEPAQKQLAEINRILGDLIGQINGMLKQASELIEQKKYISPPGDNAKEVVDRIFGIDPSSADGRGLVIDMAARCLMDGEAARAALNPDGMKQAYLTAKALGVDPSFIDKKLQGIEIIRRSKGGVVIIDSKQAESGDRKGDPRYLDMGQNDKRITVLQAQGYGQNGAEGRKLYEITKGNSR